MEFMSIKNGLFANAGGGAPQNNAPSAGDGSDYAVQDPNTSERLRTSGPRPSAQQDTSGANGGLGQSDTGAADLASYRATQRAVSRIDGNGSGGTTI